MQYNHYPSAPHQVHPSAHPSQSNDEYAPPYPDPSHHHATLPYATVNSTTHIAPQNIPPQYSYSPYATHSAPDDHRSYYAASSQASAVEHYPSPSSPTSSYATTNASGHLGTQPSRHHAHLSQQPPQQFIPTPSQTYQVYSTGGSSPTARPRSSVEPYYHMSPNPQHVVHASPSSTPATGGTGGRSSTAHRSSSQLAHPHTGTIVSAAGERFPCDLCDRSFTRLHDRRRHYETVHATSPVTHACRFCQKGFSRADSLKRHVDNGCDDMPR